MIVYRRSLEEMPARVEEVHHAQEEGVEFMTLCNPIEYLADEKGRVRAMKVQRMELGEPDASGRRSPVPIEGAIEEIEVDLVIVSVGVSPTRLSPMRFRNLRFHAEEPSLSTRKVCALPSTTSMPAEILSVAVPQ